MGKKKQAILDEVMQDFKEAEETRLNEFQVKIKCKNDKQKEFLRTLKDKKKQICFGVGAAGSGKSYISLMYALEAIANKKFKQVICIVPTCEATTNGSLSLGFLKGDYNAKIEPYTVADTYSMTKILDNSGNENSDKIVKRLFEKKMVIYELVNFARGKTWDDALILINEAENYSKEEMLLLLTRIGENSKIVISGDIEQLDRKDIKKGQARSGILHAMNVFQDTEEASIVEFTAEDVVRNPLITKILELWKK